MLRNTTRLLAALPLAVLPVVVRDTSVANAPRAEAYVVAMTVTTDEKGATERVGMTLKMAGTKLRIDMDVSSLVGALGGGGGDAAAMMKGAYMLLQADGRIAMIMPSFQNPMSGGTGMGMIMDAEMMKGRMGDAPAGATIDTALNKVSVVDLGAGEAILGHPTRHYRVTETNGAPGTTEPEVSEVWLATDMADVEAGFKRFGESFGSAFLGSAVFSGGNGQGKIPPGFPLRAIATSAGKEVMRLEVSKAEKSNIDDKEFEVPAGIQVMDIGAMMKRGR